MKFIYRTIIDCALLLYKLPSFWFFGPEAQRVDIV